MQWPIEKNETLEEKIVYKDVKNPEKIWVRPAYMWNETVKRDGKEYKKTASRIGWLFFTVSSEAEATPLPRAVQKTKEPRMAAARR